MTAIDRLVERCPGTGPVLLDGPDAAELAEAFGRRGRTCQAWPPDDGARPFDAAVCAGWRWRGAEAEHRRYLAGIRRRLRVDGVLVVDQAPPDGKVDALSGYAGHVRSYPPTELAALVRAAGFRVEELVLTAAAPWAP